MIRKLKSGEYRLYSRKTDPKAGKRRNMGTFKTRVAAESVNAKCNTSSDTDSDIQGLPMSRGFPHHLDLTVTDLPRSIAFYDKVLGELGYARTNEYAGDVPCWSLLHTDVRMAVHSPRSPRAQDAQEWLPTSGPRFSIGLHAARSSTAHDRYAAGFHHLALHADSRETIDAFHQFLLRERIRVLDAPAGYDYTPGYYAVFFADPDGLKLELVHEPRAA